MSTKCMYRFRFVMPETGTAQPILQVQSFDVFEDNLGAYEGASSLWMTVETVFNNAAFIDARDQQ